jgi:chromosome segregation ATPase
MSTTEIEKENLEAHVELCAERYVKLENKLNTVEEKVSKLETVVHEIKDMIVTMNDRRNQQLIKWGMSAIGALLAVVAWFVIKYLG